jgi:DNA-binding ferritin-like protein (Dps family)
MAKATTMGTRIKDRFEGARLQLVVLEKRIEKLPKEAKKTFGEVQKEAKKTFGEAKKTFGEAKKTFGEYQTRVEEVPAQLKGAFEQVVVRLRGVLDFASRDDLNELAEKVDDLAKKVDKLLRGEKIRSAAEKKEQPKPKKS